jgi:hypothetical protein
MRIRFTPAARAQLDAIFAYLAAENLRTAQDLVRAVETSAALLEANPASVVPPPGAAFTSWSCREALPHLLQGCGKRSADPSRAAHLAPAVEPLSMTHHAPATEAEAAALVTEAAARKTPLAVIGNGTKAAIGRPAQTAATLSAAGLTGVTLYEPAEMVMAARAGTPMAEIERILAERGQMLPFEPPDHRTLLGSAGEPTIGAVAAANLSGPRRVNAGAARDSLIGCASSTGAARR